MFLQYFDILFLIYEINLVTFSHLMQNTSDLVPTSLMYKFYIKRQWIKEYEVIFFKIF